MPGLYASEGVRARGKRGGPAGETKAGPLGSFLISIDNEVPLAYNALRGMGSPVLGDRMANTSPPTKNQAPSEMVERVTRALCQWVHDNGEKEYYDPYDLARAAIGAMREPTEAMIQAGGNQIWMRQAWRAMIDTALR
jgi:hypothetical protein